VIRERVAAVEGVVVAREMEAKELTRAERPGRALMAVVVVVATDGLRGKTIGLRPHFPVGTEAQGSSACSSWVSSDLRLPISAPEAHGDDVRLESKVGGKLAPIPSRSCLIGTCTPRLEHRGNFSGVTFSRAW
jgi:hypothetical protein